jgi:hypothetical protein
MTFFYNLNKRLADLAKRQDLTESVGSTSGFLEASTGDYSAKKAAAGKDIGKPGKMFSKIAKSAGERYGSKAAGERVAGAVLNKLRAKESVEEMDKSQTPPSRHGDYPLGAKGAIAKPVKAKKVVKDLFKDLQQAFAKEKQVKEQETDESALQAYLGKKKYGETGMKALQKAGREGASKETMARIRARHDKMDEADMEEGNKFTGNLMKARAAGLKKADLDGDGDMETVREADVVGLEEKKAKPDYIDLDKDGNRKETMKKAAADKKKSRSAGTAFDPEVAKSMFANKDEHPRYDVKDTGYSKRYTRKVQDEPKDDTEADTGPKKKGRPKGPEKGPERVTKGSYKFKSGRPAKTKEDLDTDGVMMTHPSNMSSESADPADRGEYDREGNMAKEQMHTIVSAAKELHRILRDDENLPEWVQKKIILAKEYIDTARDYMLTQHAERAEEQPIAEKAVSQQQQKFMGMAHAMQKGEKIPGASKELKQVAKTMKPKDVKDFATTKHKGLPKKVEKEETDETAEAPKETKSKGGYQFGKGIYESMDQKFKQQLTESMNVSVNMNTGPDGEPTKNITVSAEGEDAEALAQLLKMAGIAHTQEHTCAGCGKSPCGCDESLDENSPDWPTNTETSDDALQYAGGLNKPKSTGQTTVPVIASQLSRQVSMEESVELERSLFKLYKNYKTK